MDGLGYTAPEVEAGGGLILEQMEDSRSNAQPSLNRSELHTPVLHNLVPSRPKVDPHKKCDVNLVQNPKTEHTANQKLEVCLGEE